MSHPYQVDEEQAQLLIPTLTEEQEIQKPSAWWKNRALPAFGLALVVTAFALRTEIFPNRSVTTYNGSGASVPVAGMIPVMESSAPMQSANPAVFIDTTSTSSSSSSSSPMGDLMIASNPAPLPGVAAVHPSVISTAESVSPLPAQTEATADAVAAAPVAEAAETPAAPVEAETPAAVAAAAPAAETAEAAPATDASSSSSSSSAASTATDATATAAAKVVVLDDPQHPAPVRVKPVQPVTAIKSDTRLSPLSMSSYKDDNGLMRTFFTKYGLVGNRFTDKEKYHIPPAVTTTEANTKGDAVSWASSSMYASSDCSGDVVSVAGIAGQECIPLSGFGGDGSNSFMVDCSGTQVILNAYTASDCSGAVMSSAVLASTGTCYAYSATMYENPTSTSTTTSVQFTCGTPNLSGFDVQKVWITADATAQSTCTLSASTAYDGQMFEAYQSDLCVAESLGDSNAYSIKFSKDSSLSPQLTYYMGSTTCASDKSSTTALSTTCVDEKMQTGISTYSKWSYHA